MEKLYLGVDLYKRSCWVTVLDAQVSGWIRESWGQLGGWLMEDKDLILVCKEFLRVAPPTRI